MNTILWFLLTAVLWPFLAVYSKVRGGSPRKILIIQWAKLGDTVCTTPMFRAIKQAHPDWEVHLLCRKASAAAVRNNPFVDRVIPGGTRMEIIQSLSREGYGVVINCMPDAFASLIGIWCGARQRISTFSRLRGHLVSYTRLFNTRNFEYRPGDGTFRHYMKMLEPLGVPAIAYQLDFFPSDDDRKSILDWMTGHELMSGKFVCCNVSAGNAIKEWPPEHWVALADQITEQGTPMVFCTLDAARVKELREKTARPGFIYDGSGLTLGQMGALAMEAGVYVAADTGPLYVAYAAGAKVVAIVGGSSPTEQLPPPGPKVVHVLPPAGCVPWMFVTLSPRTATEEQLRCIRATTPESVVGAFRAFL